MSFIGGGGILRGMSREGISWYPILFPQSYYLLNLGLQYALNVFIFSPLVFCAYFCIWEGAGRKISRRPIYFAFASNRPIFAIFSILLSEACLIIDFWITVKKKRQKTQYLPIFFLFGLKYQLGRIKMKSWNHFSFFRMASHTSTHILRDLGSA